MTPMRTLVLPLVALALAACSKSPVDQLRDQFVEGCKSNGGSRGVCKCIFGEYEKVYSEKVLTQIGSMQRLPVDFPDQTVKAALKCKNE